MRADQFEAKLLLALAYAEEIGTGSAHHLEVRKRMNKVVDELVAEFTRLHDARRWG